MYFIFNSTQRQRTHMSVSSQSVSQPYEIRLQQCMYLYRVFDGHQGTSRSSTSTLLYCCVAHAEWPMTMCSIRTAIFIFTLRMYVHDGRQSNLLGAFSCGICPTTLSRMPNTYFRMSHIVSFSRRFIHTVDHDLSAYFKFTKKLATRCGKI